jgi:hypothetical protein
MDAPTVTPGMTPPLSSAIVPPMDPVDPWPAELVGAARANSAPAANARYVPLLVIQVIDTILFMRVM